MSFFSLIKDKSIALSSRHLTRSSYFSFLLGLRNKKLKKQKLHFALSLSSKISRRVSPCGPTTNPSQQFGLVFSSSSSSLIEINRRIVILHHPPNRMQSPTTTTTTLYPPAAALQRPIMKEPVTSQEELLRLIFFLLLLHIPQSLLLARSLSLFIDKYTIYMYLVLIPVANVVLLLIIIVIINITDTFFSPPFLSLSHS